MYVSIHEKDGLFIGTTEGCGCCSKEEEIKEVSDLHENIEILIEGCKALGINLEDAIKNYTDNQF